MAAQRNLELWLDGTLISSVVSHLSHSFRVQFHIFLTHFECSFNYFHILLTHFECSFTSYLLISSVFLGYQSSRRGGRRFFECYISG
jgi:hypothetical protein